MWVFVLAVSPASIALLPPPRALESPQFRPAPESWTERKVERGGSEGKNGEDPRETHGLNKVTSPSCYTGTGVILTLIPSGPQNLHMLQACERGMDRGL